MKDVLDKAFDDLEDSINNPKRVLHVGFILDASGSMHYLSKFVIDTFNEQLKILQKETDETMKTKASVIVFDYPDRINFLRWEEDIANVKEISYEEYRPDGSTALYDAIGMTLDRYRELPDYMNETTSFLLNIVTDGFENASIRYQQQQIKSLLDELQATKRWTVTYYGADQRMMTEQFHVPMQNTMVFNAQEMTSGEYRGKAMNSTLCYMNSIKSGSTAVEDFYMDKTSSDASKNPPKTKITSKKK